MKLYTEKDIANAVMFGRWGGTTKKEYEDFLKKITHIELPSDEEIYNEAQIKKDNIKLLPFDMASFQFGAMWLKDKIQGGNK